MVPENDSTAGDRIVIGYFSNSDDATRAVHELIDEGFRPTEMGAAFRSPVSSVPVGGGRVRGGTPENPELSGSVGGPASHDEAVTPAGLAPGSGNAFPAPARPAEPPGSEIPSTLRHELKHDLPSTLQGDPEANVPLQAVPGGTANMETEEDRRQRLRRAFGEDAGNAGEKRTSSMKFGTGEGHLFPDYEYSAPAFESSFAGMGLGAAEARSLSGELRRGGAVITVEPGDRTSLAEAIIERNRGSVRFESISGTAEVCDSSQVEIYGRMRNYYRPAEESERRRAS